MKLILLFLFTINTVFGGQCPPEEVISPCKCYQPGNIVCQTGLSNVSKVFNSLSKTNYTHFEAVQLFAINHYDKSDTILQDNVFGNITFSSFIGLFIKKISTNAFDSTANKLKRFSCWTCNLQNQPPKHDIRLMLNKLTHLESLTIGLNVTEIPENWIQPINGQNQSKLDVIEIDIEQSLTVKSGAFQNLNNLRVIEISGMRSRINLIEKGAFKLNSKSDKEFRIIFWTVELTNESFQNGSFDDIDQRPLKIDLLGSDINYLDKTIFGSVLASKNNSIDFTEPNQSHGLNSKIDCEDCRNYWLIKENKQQQVLYAFCKGNPKLNLFDKEIKTKLSQKCK